MLSLMMLKLVREMSPVHKIRYTPSKSTEKNAHLSEFICTTRSHESNAVCAQTHLSYVIHVKLLQGNERRRREKACYSTV